MKPVKEKQHPFFWQFGSNAFLSFFDESHIANHRAKLLRPFIAGDFPSQRLEASAVSTGKDYSPFMFALHGDSLTAVGPVLRESIHGYSADNS
jgi:hypothetical protein